MAYINTAEHEKFIRFFGTFIESGKSAEADPAFASDIKVISEELAELEEIAGSYKRTLSRLQELSTHYKIIHNRTKANMRKFRIKLKKKESLS